VSLLIGFIAELRKVEYCSLPANSGLVFLQHCQNSKMKESMQYMIVENFEIQDRGTVVVLDTCFFNQPESDIGGGAGFSALYQ